MCLISEVFHPGRKHTKRNYGLLAAGKDKSEACLMCISPSVFLARCDAGAKHVFSVFVLVIFNFARQCSGCPPIHVSLWDLATANTR